MPFLDKFVLAGCALLLFGVSWLMKTLGGENALIQDFSAFSLALSVIVAAISVGLLITQ